MKKAIYYEEAKRLYVVEGFSLDAIVQLLKKQVSRKTLYNWKTQNHWDEQRQQYLAQTEHLQHELLDIARTTIREAKAHPTPHNIYAVAKAISALKLLQGVSLDQTKQDASSQKGLKKETLEFIQRELLGL